MKKKSNYSVPKYFVPLIASGLIIIALISVLAFWRIAVKAGDAVIAQDVELLAKVLKQIDDQCIIIGFEHQRDYIDFLNVVKFVGSEVGSMNLTYPEKWQGPYLQENPTYQEKLYEIVKTKKGYYIAPGYGVKLSNKKVIGKDILYDENVDLEQLSENNQPLNYKGKPLAMQLKLSLQTPPEMQTVPDILDIG